LNGVAALLSPQMAFRLWHAHHQRHRATQSLDRVESRGPRLFISLFVFNLQNENRPASPPKSPFNGTSSSPAFYLFYVHTYTHTLLLAIYYCTAFPAPLTLRELRGVARRAVAVPNLDLGVVVLHDVLDVSPIVAVVPLPLLLRAGARDVGGGLALAGYRVDGAQDVTIRDVRHPVCIRVNVAGLNDLTTQSASHERPQPQPARTGTGGDWRRRRCSNSAKSRCRGPASRRRPRPPVSGQPRW